MGTIEIVGVIGGICLIVVLSFWMVVLSVFCTRAMVQDIAEGWEILGEKRKLEKEISELKRKNIDLEEKVNALDKECKMYLDEAVEIAEEKNAIAKYADFLVKNYEEVYEEKRKLEWQNERLREQVEFFERELSTEEDEKNAECRMQNSPKE